MTRILSLLIASSVLGLGCGCPTQKGINSDRRVTGQLTYQPPGAAATTGDLAAASGFSMNADSAGAYPGEVAFTLTPDQASAFPLRLVVSLAPAAASDEVDLTDSNASLTVHVPTPPSVITYHGVGGHLSIQGIDTSCGLACPLRAHGTLTVSATGSNDEVFALTAGTFVANDTVYDTGICQGD